ncbi:MAG TPA: tetratricopeptide repeat protein [Vicinamibacterales bacterium]|nr:tetratricopeptide repeat protein [Vicinamibacterales bacterium]
MKRLLAGLLLLAIAGTAVYGYTVSRRERTYRELIAQGESVGARDNTFAAIEAFSGAIALKPESMLGYLKRGEVYRRRGDLDAALRDLQRASDLDPTATRPLELLGDVEYALERYTAAAGRYRAYVALDDRAPRLSYKLALAEYRAGRLDLAIDAVRRAIALDDRMAEAHYLLGICLRERGKTAPARDALVRAVALAPALLAAREELADLDRLLGRTEERLVQLEALCALDPGPARDITLGLAYADAGQRDRAVLTLGRAAERYPEHTATYVALGRVWLEAAQARGDRIALSKALGALQGAIGPNDTSEALTLFGRALLMTHDAEGAERMLQDATRREPVDPLAYYHLAEASARLRHYDEARRALLDYEALHGPDADPHQRAAHAVRLGDLSMRLNDRAAAVRYYGDAAAAETVPAALARINTALARARAR